MSTESADGLPYGKDARLRVRDDAPFNAGPPAALLGDAVITPASLFFTRSHGLVPRVDAGTWRLEVRGMVERPLHLTLELLQRNFTRRTVAATLVCAGLRREELLAVHPIPGELPWDLEPIGTGQFAGVALRDVLTAAGVADTASHVEFIGLDTVERRERTFGFGGSIPLAKALAPEVLLAFEMNGGPLPAVHGGPLRVVVPGYIGARSVKWLGAIEVRATPSENYFQAEAYRVLRQVQDRNPRDVSRGEALGEVPLNAVILSPEPRCRRSPGPVVVSGWAFGSGARRPARIEVSGDDGATWQDAIVDATAGEWSWVMWHAELFLAAGRRTLVVRAWDADGTGQPATPAEVWNVKGYANNAWHRVPIEVIA